MKNRNPNWTRDELILALELYMRVNPLHTSESHPEIVALSETLKGLPIYPAGRRDEEFRNPSGVYMKLCNFLRFDPGYDGAGLERGNKLEQPVWEEFSSDPERLQATASAIRATATLLTPPSDLEELAAEADEEFPEGRLLTRIHKRRERSPAATRRKKNAVMDATGTLTCEVCGFDFSIKYGELGRGFAECHHRRPLSDLQRSRSTRLADLAIVCANCHRMLHRARPWTTVEELRASLSTA